MASLVHIVRKVLQHGPDLARNEPPLPLSSPPQTQQYSADLKNKKSVENAIHQSPIWEQTLHGRNCSRALVNHVTPRSIL